ncbi:MAG: ATP-binding cassette domain-containing protein [Oscillospiraceae bacterium]|nr:ATP-binding cassette domain-containing protein [Oscillospiraceae bacterium]
MTCIERFVFYFSAGYEGNTNVRISSGSASRQQSNENIAMLLISQLAPVYLNFGMLIFYLVVMLRFSVTLTLVGLISVALNIGVSAIISKKRVNLTRVQMRDSGKLAGATVAGIDMIETLKASGSESGFFEKWAGYQATVNTSQVKFTKLNMYLGAVPSFVSQLANIVILMLGIVFIMDKSFTVGMLLVFQGYISAFSSPAQQMIGVGQALTETRTNMERIEDVLSYPVAPQCAAMSDELPEYDKLSGRIELKTITFGYSPLEAPLIKGFDLTVNPGERIAIVGGSGCGKSTVAKLISGLYPSASGEILFDGVPIDRINHEIFTSSVAMVDQEITLFADSIANNIKMWDKSIEDFEMIMAARDAQMHEVIMQRDGGYKAEIAEGGRDFSGGQRQRLEIARVLAGDPTIVIMDEATSALDAKTEYNVVKSITDRGITCIIIAHRLSTIRDCDEIIVMERGEIIERGKHDALYASGGLYTRLVSNE